ncbi:SDR family NAD(P)-dependent oxidoreductase [Streptomyces sp. P10-4]|uniref:SDR family NAD(P)-dependent oxidoreductase n=2 Tax=Streptomyces TaxID=1883 RepID=UPI003D2E6BBB
MSTPEQDLVKALRASVKETARLRQKNAQLLAAASEPIAIVSIGCRFAGGITGPEDFWKVVSEGTDVYTPFPDDRGWDLEGLYDPDPDTPGTTYVNQGAFLHDAAQFDARFFGISPQEAMAMDPQQRQLLEVCWETLERSGIDPHSLRGSDTGVYAGIVHQDYAPDLPGAEDFLSLERALGSAGGIASGRVAYCLGLEGPAVTVDTMCSSSLVAIHLATQALRRGECSLALAGGATVMATPGGFVGFARQRGLAFDGRCKSFAAAADGSSWAEGVGVVLLERLSDAEANGHRVLAVIRGSAVNSDGASNGLTAPNGPSQQRVIRSALAAADLSTDDIDAVEAHGTGTTLGDPIEAQALIATYGQGRDPKRPLLLGSVKSVLGHTQAASGVAAVIKTVLALRHRYLPATLHVDTPTPQVDWSAGTVELLTEGRDWPENGRPRRCGISSFGASGTNVHMILEEAPDTPAAEAPAPAPAEPEQTLPFIVSARTPTALARQAQRLGGSVDDGAPLGDLASALVTSRALMSHRAVVLARTRDELRRGLALLAEGRTGTGVLTGAAGQAGPGKTVFAFPGQGTQWAGMGRELLDTSPVFAARIAECEEEFDRWVDWSLTEVLRGDGSELERVDVVQPVCFAVMVALAEVWKSAGVVPDAVIGHSQGEIAAACVAGALSLADAARVVTLRSQAIAHVLPRGGGMASVGLPVDEVRSRIAPWAERLQVAAVNGPSTVVVAGEADALDELAAHAAEQGFRFRRIPVDYASHSHYVEDIRSTLEADLAGLATSPPRIPFYSTVESRWLGKEDRLDAGYWYRNLRQTVLFDPAVRELIAEGHRVFVELGAHPVLTPAVTDIAEELDADVLAVGSTRRDEGGLDRMLTSMAEAFVRGVTVDWTTAVPERGPAPLDLPTYPFEHQRYWITMPGTRAGAESLGQTTSDHPLLGAVVELPQTDGLVFTSRLSLATHPWLAGHRIQNTVLVPGTAYVDLAIRAGDQFGHGVLDELVIEAPLVLPAEGAVRVQVAVGGTDTTGRRPVEVYSSRDGEGWTRHAAGTLSDSSADTGGSGFDFGQWPPPGAHREDVDDFYARLADRGYDYGPAFAGLTAVWRRGEEIFAEAVLPAEHREDVDKFGIHPALLDAALHANAFHRRDDDRNVLPFAWNGVRLHATGAGALRVRVAPAGPDALSFDAADETGALVLTMQSLVSLPLSDLGTEPARQAPDTLWQLDWTRVPPAAGRPADHQALVATSGDVARIALAEELGEPVPDLAVLDLTAHPDAGTPAADDPLPLLCRVLGVLQAWLEEPLLATVPLVVATRGAVPAPGPVTDPAAAAVWGLLRAAQAENPGRFVLVDLEPGADRDRAIEAALATGEPQTAVRDDAILAPRLGRARLTEPGTPTGFAEDGTVLITGGTGVLGALLARHLVTEHGVRHLVLASRRGPAAEGVTALVDELTAQGASVAVTACDVSDRDALAALLAAVPAEHPLTGVVHAAGVLDDGVIAGLDPHRMAGVFAPKAGALRLLDELTRDRPPQVFAAFSSAASVFGSAGQGNYAAANAYVDAVVSARRAAGLPAVSLAWGLWSPATGMTGGLAEVDRTRMSRGGVRPMPTAEALALFDLGIRCGDPLLVPIRLDLAAVRAESAADGTVPPLFRALVRPARRTAQAGADAQGALARRLAGLSDQEQTELVLDLIRTEVAVVLGLGQADPAMDAERFGDIGFDSLTAVELRNRLSAATAVKLPATLIFDYPTPRALARHLLEQVGGTLGTVTPERPAAPAEAPDDDPVVIVGMACRLPGGVTSPAELWQLVADGRDGISQFPDDRGWNLDRLFDSDPDRAGTAYTRQGGFLHDAGYFDAALFGISPREALAMDPQQRLLLETTWQVLESAGIDPLSLRGQDVGVYTGMSIHDYLGSLADVPSELEGFTTTATAGSVASGRVSYVFGLEGPAMTVDTACSSSLVAIHLAAQALRQGECALALAGGVAVMGSPVGVTGFSRARGLAADGRCKAFSAAADGTVLSEGVGVVLLERLSDARRNGHRVLAVIRGSAVNQDGASNGLTAPNGPSQQRVIRAALAAAGIAPDEVDALEAHGTGTTLGDPSEAQAIIATYGRDRSPDRPLWLGSVKSNLGHTQAAAGVTSVIKMVGALAHGTLPATLFVDEPTPHVDWSAGTVSLLTESRPWPETGRPRRAGISSFGISGTNAHLILEQAPAEPAVPASEAVASEPAATAAEPPESGADAVLPFVVSAHTPAALAGQAERLRAAVATGLSLPGTARTLLDGRALLAHRAVVAAADRAALLKRLDAIAAGETVPGTTVGTAAAGAATSAVFVFPGQGAQRPGMGRELYARFPVYAAAFDEACARLDDRLGGAAGTSVRDVVLAAPDTPQAALLDQTVYTQAGLFAVETALFRLAESWGIRPRLLLGHSIGEITAAHVAGMLSLDDAATVVAARGRLMQALPAGGAMAAVAATEDEVRPFLGSGVDIAAVNQPSSVVLSGDEDAVLAAADALRAQGRKVKRLKVSHAFHSARMDPMLAEFRAAIAGVAWQPPRIRVVAHQDGDMTSPDYWVEHVRRTVRFADGVAAALQQGGKLFVEMGPGAALATAVLETAAAAGAEPVCAPMLRDGHDEAQTAIGALAELFVRGVPADWQALLPADAPAVELPTYAFDRAHYWVKTADGRTDATGLGQVAAGHPLLSAVVPVPDTGGLVGTVRLSSATHPWLDGHRVHGATVVNSAALLDLAVRAGDEVGCGVVARLAVETPLVVPPDTGVRVEITVGAADEQGCRPFAIHGARDGSTAWVRHADGQLSARTPAAPDPVPRAWPPAGAEPVETPEDSPVLLGLWRRGEETYAEVALGDDGTEPGDAPEFGCDPALLETVTRAVTAGAAVATVWEEVVLHASGARRLRARLTPLGADRWTLEATDESGMPVVSARSWTAAPVRPEDVGAGAAADAMYRVVWTAAEPSETPPGRTAMAPVASPEDVTAFAGRTAAPAAAGTHTGAEETGPDGRRHSRPATAVLDVAAGRAAQPLLARVLAVLQAWQHEAPADARLVVVTRGAVPAGTTTVTDVPSAAVWGLVRAAQAEMPDRILLLDLDPATATDAATAIEVAGTDAATAIEVAGTDPATVTDLATVTDPAAIEAAGADPAAATGPGPDTEVAADVEAAVAAALATGEPQVAVRGTTLLLPRLAPAGPLAERNPEQPALDPDGTVLITGGTGSLGALVARHLVRARGVRHLLLAGRRGPAAEGAEDLVAELSGLGATVTVAGCDVSDRDAVAALLATVPAAHPLTAVVHTAGVLDDGLLGALDPARLATVLGPKAEGARHLDELTRDSRLAAFVAFSSAAGLLGSAGQANYSAANAYVDGLMAARRAAGRPGLALSWGLWEQTGGMTGHLDAADRARMSRGGVLPLRPEEGLALLDAALDSGEAHVVPIRLDLAAARADAASGGPVQPLLRDLVRVRRRAGRTTGAGDLLAALVGLSPAEQEARLLTLVRSRAALVLGHTSADGIEPDSAFKGAGMDSLGAVELRNRLAAATGLTLPATLVYDYPTPRQLAGFLRAELAGTAAAPTEPAPAAAAGTHDDIAVVGLGCRLAGGVRGPDDFWELLVRRGEGRSPFPTDRGWDLSAVPVEAGSFLTDAAEFDAGFFGISPREAVAMDPQQRLLLEVVWEALEDGGLDPAALRGTDVGVFVGVMGQGYGMFGGDAQSDGLRGTGGAVSVVSGRVSYVYGFTGPAVSVDTACSSSLVAMHLAIQALRNGECSLAVVGGVTVMATPGAYVEFAKNGGLAADGRCKAFAASADGTGNGEGVGVVLLERLADAHANGHAVSAVVRGSAISQDGASNGLTAPNGPAQQRVIRRALAVAGVAPADVDAVEAHGTGTRLGDPIEAQALLATYGRRDPEQPLWLGSVKSNIGHTQAAAGVASVIKMVLALRHQALPATLHVDAPTPEVDWSSGTIQLLTDARPWPSRPGRTRRAGVSAFGLSGTNAHLILEEPPRRPDETLQEPPRHGDETPQESLRRPDETLREPSPRADEILREPSPRADRILRDPSPRVDEPGESPAENTPLPFVVTAGNPARLAALADRLADFAERGTAPLPTLAAALAHGRTHHETRATVIAADRAELVGKLRALAAGGADQAVTGRPSAAGTEVVFVFPGQGGHWAGMGRALMDHEPEFRAWVRRCDALLAEYDLDWTLEQALGGENDLSRVDVIQPASFVMMTGLAQLWASAGVVPDVVLGASQGEIAAACVAGLLSVEDGLRAIVLRSRMAAALPSTGGMLVVGVSRARMTEMLADYAGRVEIAAVNGPATVAVSGERAAIEELAAAAADQQLWFRRIRADYASHSFLVDELREPMLAALDGIGKRPAQGLVPGCRFYSTVDGRWIGPDELLDAGYWFRNLRRPVELDSAVRAVSADARALVEVSAHPGLVPSLLDIIQDTGRSTPVLATLRRGEGGRERLTTAFAEAFAAGLPVSWATTLPAEPTAWRELCRDLPTYPFDHRRYWLRSAPTTDTGALGLARTEHPLLATMVELPASDGLTAMARLSAHDQPWLTAGTDGGPAEVPCAVWVELAVRAGDEVDCGTLDQLELRAPLVLGPGDAVRLQVSVDGADAAGRRPVTVRSAPAAQDRRRPVWTVHAEGVLSPTAMATPAAPEPDPAPWPPPGAEPVALDELPAATGAASPPALRALWRRGEDTYADVALPADQADTAAQFGVHPLLLEAAAHAAGFPAGHRPSAWQRVVLHATGASALRVRLRRTGDGVGLEAADHAGLPVLTAARVTARPATAVPAGRHGRALRTEWVPLDTAPTCGAVEVAAVDGDTDVYALAAAPPTVAAAVFDVGTGREPGDACRRALAVAQAWLDEPDLEGRRLVVRTRAAVPAGPEGTGAAALDPAAAAVWEMIAAIQAEYPGRFVLLDTAPEDAGASPADPGQSALGRVLAADAPQAAVRAGRVHVPRLVPADATDATARALDPDGTVLIVGGTGTAGARLARHLVAEHGVRHLLLAGRGGPGTEGAAALAADITALGASVTVRACDAGDRDALRRLLDGIPDDHPLTGVVHAVGLPDDTRLAELDADRLTEVIAARTESLRHLDDLTAAAGPALFLVVTSAAALLGPVHHPANAAADGLARAVVARRRTAGLAGCAPVLLPAEAVTGADGTTDQDVTLSAVSEALRSGEPFAVPGRPEQWAAPAAGRPVPPLLRGLVRMRRRSAAHAAQSGATAENGWTDLLSGQSPKERERTVLDLVQAQLTEVLELDPAEPVDAERGFFELGLDSVLAIELSRRLGGRTGTALTPAAVFAHPTPAALTGYLLAHLEGSKADA